MGKAERQTEAECLGVDDGDCKFRGTVTVEQFDDDPEEHWYWVCPECGAGQRL